VGGGARSQPATVEPATVEPATGQLWGWWGRGTWGWSWEAVGRRWEAGRLAMGGWKAGDGPP